MGSTQDEVAVRHELRETPSRWDKASLAEIEARLEELVGQRRAASREPAAVSDPRVIGGRHTGRLLGNLLVNRGHLVESELHYALEEQAATGRRLGEVVVALGLISDHALSEVLGEQYDLDVVHLGRIVPDVGLVQSIPASLARRVAIVAFARSGAYVDVAVADPTDERAIADVAALIGANLRLHVAPARDILDIIDRFGV